MEYKDEYQWLTNVCLNLTDSCNLACRYCFVEQHPHFMRYQTALDAVKYLLDNLDKKRAAAGNPDLRASITYFGGEPMIMYDDIIKPLTEYIRQNDLPIDLSMTTNGTLLNEDRIKFFYDNNVNILLSIDGDKETQDYNRPCRDRSNSSFDLVEKNIEPLLKYFPYTTFRGTVYAETAHKTFENYLYAYQLGFQNIFFMPDGRHPWMEEQKEALHQEIHKIFSFLDYCYCHNSKPINFSPIDNAFKHIVHLQYRSMTNYNRNIDMPRNISRCGLATTLGSIGYDGSIYGCQEQPSKDESNIFYIGDIYQGINPLMHLKLLSEYNSNEITICNNPTLCNNCLIQPICHLDCCPSSSYDLFHNFFIEAEIQCLWRKWLIEDALVLLNNRQDNNLFMQYFKSISEYNNYFEEAIE